MGFLSDLLGGRQRTVPTSSSTTYGTTRSSSAASSTGVSSSFGRSRSEIFAPEFFEQLFGSASGAAARAASAVPGLQGQAATLFNAGSRFLGDLEGPLATDERLADEGSDDELIGLLGSDLGRFFSEEINPQITGRGVATGTLGGSRGEVARGTAARGLAQEFARGSAEIRQAGRARRDTLAATSDQLRAGRTTAGLSALPGLFGLAEAGLGAELAPFLALSQILGGPTVLSSSESGSASSEISRAIEEAFGEQTSSSSGSTVTRGPGLLDVLNTVSGFV